MRDVSGATDLVRPAKHSYAKQNGTPLLFCLVFDPLLLDGGCLCDIIYAKSERVQVSTIDTYSFLAVAARARRWLENGSRQTYSVLF
jgi:hypothetical protein